MSMARLSGDQVPPFERKFLVDEAQAAMVAAWAAQHLEPDPHAAGPREGIYQVSSLYLDTERLDVYHRRGSHARAKYRLRRYDAAEVVFAERKCKVRGLVRKRRTPLDAGRLSWLSLATPPDDWDARWFARRVAARRLLPTCLVSYRRMARVGHSHLGPIRLTIDDAFQAEPAEGLVPPLVTSGKPMLAGLGIVELKFRVAMPAAFKTLVAEFGLTPSPASKYRSAIVACGLATDSGEVTRV